MQTSKQITQGEIMTLMVTGHRQIVPLNHVGSPYPDRNPVVRTHQDYVTQAMLNLVRAHALNGSELGKNTTNYISGMAIGADQLFAAAVVALQDEFLAGGINHTVNLIAAVPFEGQESKWPKRSQEIYHVLLARAAHVEYVCPPGYAAWKMQWRNEWMVNNSNIVLAVWDGKQSGGTYNCITYARQCGKSLFGLNPYTLNAGAILDI